MDRNSNNLINISINDELSSRRHNGNLINNNISSSNNLNLNNNRNENQRFFCHRCSFNFNNQFELEHHNNICGVLRNNQMMHNSINEILHLVQTLNRHLQSEGRLNSVTLFGLDEPEDIFDFIDWKYNPDINSWKNEGKININCKFFFI